MTQASQGGPAPVPRQGLFKGVAVVIDDSVGKADDGINAIIKGINDGGGHAIVLDKLPDENADLENFSNVSFFIMDWNLSNIPKGQIVPPELARSLAEDNARFLNRLREHRHAPVFIFTHDNVDTVKQELVRHGVLRDDDAESHILIRNKEDVGEGVYETLNEWLEQTPSALTLRTWERSYLKAVNALFMDFHERNRYWPVIFWQGFKNDKVPPGDELGRLISRLVASRMHPFNADLTRFEADVQQHALANADSYAASVLQVLEGERIVRSERLEPTSFAPGDLFEVIDKDGKSRYFLNVRAECDCVIRGKPKDALLYLLKGRIETRLDVNHDMGSINEKDNEAIVFGMMDGKTFRFGFRDLVIKPWNDLADKRKARLLSPFITRVIQRYAAYSQRPGLPRIPAAVLPVREDGPIEKAIDDHASPICNDCTDQCPAEVATNQENSAA